MKGRCAAMLVSSSDAMRPRRDRGMTAVRVVGVDESRGQPGVSAQMPVKTNRSVGIDDPPLRAWRRYRADETHPTRRVHGDALRMSAALRAAHRAERRPACGRFAWT